MNKDIVIERKTKRSDLISLVKLLAAKFFYEVTEDKSVVVKFYAAPLQTQFVSEWHFDTKFFNNNLKPFFITK